MGGSPRGDGKRRCPLYTLACARGEKKVSHDGVSGQRQGHCMAVVVVCPSWLVQGRVRGSEGGEVVDVWAMMS